jgi:hypothetical protein
MHGLLLRIAALLCLLLGATGCHDVTLPQPSAADLPAAVPVLNEEYQSLACCDPVIVVAPGPVEPACDPYTDPNFCQGSGDDCMMSGGVGGDVQGITDCNSGGSDGGSDGSSPPPPPGDTVEPDPEGPLLWGACVLAMVGSVYAIDQVGAKFEAWWEAQKEYNRARAVYQYTWDNQDSLVDPSSLAIAEMRMNFALQRRDDAIGAVHDLTGASIFALAAAAVTCGPAVFAPTL